CFIDTARRVARATSCGGEAARPGASAAGCTAATTAVTRIGRGDVGRDAVDDHVEYSMFGGGFHERHFHIAGFKRLAHGERRVCVACGFRRHVQKVRIAAVVRICHRAHEYSVRETGLEIGVKTDGLPVLEVEE